MFAFAVRTDDFKPAVLVVSFVGMITQEVEDRGEARSLKYACVKTKPPSMP